jgi:alkylated DNA repair dioxygenase AlkB
MVAQEQPPPQGFALTSNAVSQDTWFVLQEWIHTNRLLGKIQPIPRETGAQNRQVAQFGFRYDYGKDIVDTATPTPPIPPSLLDLLGIPPEYTQCIINKYEPNILIPWHKDDLAFGPTVLVYSFGEERPLWMRCADNYDEQYQVIPTHCSKYVLSGEARYDWEHMVPTGKHDRTSFTFRSQDSKRSK